MRIIPSAIEHNGTFHSRISRNQSLNSAWQKDPPWDKLADKGLMAQANIRVHETARELAIEVGILDEEGQAVNTSFNPYYMPVGAGIGSGLVNCDWRHHEDGDTLPQDIKALVDRPTRTSSAQGSNTGATCSIITVSACNDSSRR